MSIRSWKRLNKATLETETTARGLGDTLRGLQEEIDLVLLYVVRLLSDNSLK